MNTAAKTISPQKEPHHFTKRIGSSHYKVAIHFSDTSKENLQDKILRLAKNDLTRMETSGKIKAPQTERLLKGGSSHDE